MADVPAIRGHCDPRFAGVRDALAQNFAEHGEVGAAVAVTIDGRPVVDLWAGWCDAARTRPWQEETLVDVFSVGKAMAALALLMLVERGRIVLDAPVARWWPAFAAHGKGDVTVRALLAHRAGLPGIRRPLAAGAIYDWDGITAALADEPPWWEPDRAHGYHVNTFGFLVGELVRRASGTGFGRFFRDAIAGPLGADVHFGVGPEDDARIADHLLPDDDTHLADYLLAAEQSDDPARRAFLHAVYANPPGASGFGTVNTRAWRAAIMPSTNGHANARAVARVYAVLATGGAPLLASGTIDAAIAEASAGADVVLARPSRFGLGFQLTRPGAALGTNPRSFGHFGAGGAVGFADPDARLAFAYTMNAPGPRLNNPRNRALIDAVYAAL